MCTDVAARGSPRGLHPGRFAPRTLPSTARSCESALESIVKWEERASSAPSAAKRPGRSRCSYMNALLRDASAAAGAGDEATAMGLDEGPGGAGSEAVAKALSSNASKPPSVKFASIWKAYPQGFAWFI